MAQEHENSESLLSSEQIEDGRGEKIPQRGQGFTLKRKKLALLGVVVAIALAALIVVLTLPSEEVVEAKSPAYIRLALPTDWPTIPIKLGRSRVAEVLFFSGHDDRRRADYKTAANRGLVWSVSPAGIIEVDAYGRIDTLRVGKAMLKVQSVSNSEATDSRWVEVLPAS